MAICLLAIPAGVWSGRRLHGALDQRSGFPHLLPIADRHCPEAVSGFFA